MSNNGSLNYVNPLFPIEGLQILNTIEKNKSKALFGKNDFHLDDLSTNKTNSACIKTLRFDLDHKQDQGKYKEKYKEKYKDQETEIEKAKDQDQDQDPEKEIGFFEGNIPDTKTMLLTKEEEIETSENNKHKTAPNPRKRRYVVKKKKKKTRNRKKKKPVQQKPIKPKLNPIEKRRRVLERNRIHAKESRERKKSYLTQLEHETKQLKGFNQELNNKVGTLSNSNQNLKNDVRKLKRLLNHSLKIQNLDQILKDDEKFEKLEKKILESRRSPTKIKITKIQTTTITIENFLEDSPESSINLDCDGGDESEDDEEEESGYIEYIPGPGRGDPQETHNSIICRVMGALTRINSHLNWKQNYTNALGFKLLDYYLTDYNSA
ncbi:transcriptional activator hac1 [Anaeramoeba flamelloides]|uniref:Transcriptional activator hac1 n=1 Tax=Anaeramoeba flamelloides TaxID=1746091 RepID=A0ABQ8X673_9EUKA|nr:transcriptional activator hac1 [Anaeramoeba flamelloides]